MINDKYTEAKLKDQLLAIQVALKPILADVPKSLANASDEMRVAICVASQMRNALKQFGIEV
jgi:hypothetical protein